MVSTDDLRMCDVMFGKYRTILIFIFLFWPYDAMTGLQTKINEANQLIA